MEKICIIGFGKLGSHLYYALNGTKKFRVYYTIKSSKTKIETSKLNSCNIIFICTGDSAIAKIVNELSGKNFNLKNKYVFHTSGALDSVILNPLERKGAYTGSLHPVQTFDSKASTHNKRLAGIYIVTEGGTKASAKAFEITKALKSKSVMINKTDKVFHHINSVFASNYLVVFISLLEMLSHELSNTYNKKKILKNGFNKSSFLDIYKPLIEQTLKNINSKGTVKSLTGPIERNDLTTVKLHLDALSKRIPQLLTIYVLMGREAAKLALKKKSISKNDAHIMINLLDKYLYFSQSKKKKN